MPADTLTIAAAAGCAPRLSVLVAHELPLVRIGVASTLRDSTSWDVQVLDRHSRRATRWPNVSGFNVVISDETHARALLSVGRAPKGASPATKPKLILITPGDRGPEARSAVAPSVDGCVSVRCAETELLKALRRICVEDATAIEPDPVQVTAEEEGLTAGAAAPAARGGLAPGALRRVLEHLRAHVAEPITLEELAGIARLSVSHFARAFRESVGVAPHRYLMRLRIARACELIRDTDRPLADISLEVGLADQSHLTRLFVALVGERPRDFRRQHR